MLFLAVVQDLFTSRCLVLKLVYKGRTIRYLRGGLGNFSVHEFFFHPPIACKNFFFYNVPLHDIFFKVT